MTKRRVQFVFVSLVVIALVWLLYRAGVWSAARSATVGTGVKVGFNVGESAPDFELRSLDGRTVRLSSLRGKPVFLNYWATWCAPCRVEMPWLVELDRQYGPQGVEMLGVSLDDPGEEKEVAKFAAERHVRYTILIGDPSVASMYGGVRFMPQSFFIDRDGKITKTTLGLTNKNDLEEGLKKLLANPEAKIHPEPWRLQAYPSM